jgi:hypothetical protein
VGFMTLCDLWVKTWPPDFVTQHILSANK